MVVKQWAQGRSKIIIVRIIFGLKTKGNAANEHLGARQVIVIVSSHAHSPHSANVHGGLRQQRNLFEQCNDSHYAIQRQHNVDNYYSFGTAK